MQGLPLCTCPSMYVCRGVKKREVCGTDGQTYESRCHMRIASCDEGVAVRKKHRGPCGEKSVEANASSNRKKVKKFKKRKRRGRKEVEEADTEDRQEKRRRRERKRKRRRSGKSRARRHRGKGQDSEKTFEEAFSHYTWKA